MYSFQDNIESNNLLKQSRGYFLNTSERLLYLLVCSLTSPVIRHQVQKIAPSADLSHEKKTAQVKYLKKWF